MDQIRRENLNEQFLVGRDLWKAIGASAPYEDTISAGFARFSLKNGKMVMHRHEREIIYVLDAKGVTTQFGFDPNNLEERRLQTGDLLRFHEDEWHIFKMDDEESYLDILFFFSIPQNHTIEIE